MVLSLHLLFFIQPLNGRCPTLRGDTLYGSGFTYDRVSVERLEASQLIKETNAIAAAITVTPKNSKLLY